MWFSQLTEYKLERSYMAYFSRNGADICYNPYSTLRNPKAHRDIINKIEILFVVTG